VHKYIKGQVIANKLANSIYFPRYDDYSSYNDLDVPDN